MQHPSEHDPIRVLPGSHGRGRQWRSVRFWEMTVYGADQQRWLIVETECTPVLQGISQCDQNPHQTSQQSIHLVNQSVNPTLFNLSQSVNPRPLYQAVSP